MKLYLIFAFAVVLVTLVSAKNIPEPNSNQDLAEEAAKIAEKYAALEKERKEAVENANKGFNEIEEGREEEVMKIEDEITELEKDQKETVDQINANFANLEKQQEKAMEKIEEKMEEKEEMDEIEEIMADKEAQEYEENQKLFELVRVVLDEPNIKEEIIAMDRRFSPAVAGEIFSDVDFLNEDNSLKNGTVTYRMQCDGFKNDQCAKCTLMYSFNQTDFMHPYHVTNFKCGN